MKETLRLFGLNGYEAQAYSILLTQGTLTAYQIAKLSAVPAGKIYPVLDALERKGCVITHSGRPKNYTGVAPEIALDGIIDRERKRLEQLKREMNSLVVAIPPPTPKPQDIVETYFSHHTSFQKSIVLHGKTQKYWRTISKLTINKEHLDACTKAIKKGVVIQALTSLKDTTPDRIAEWRRRGISVRILEELPFRMSIYDDQGVIFRFSHNQEYVATHIINPQLAKGMNTLFERLWKTAKTIKK